MSGASASAGPADAAHNPDVGRKYLRLRIVLLGFGALGLLSGMWGGLWRLGWALPHGSSLAELHAPLMICGLFGTLISLERAVALGGGWFYAAPVLSALGSFALLAGLPPRVGMSFYTLSAAALVAASALVTFRHPALFTATLLFGALALLTGDILWLVDAAMPHAAGWWLAFLILTIAAERLELSRILPPKAGSAGLFLAAIGLLAAGAGFGLTSEYGSTLFGAGLLACSAWLLRHDIAVRNVRLGGQTRFFAACMLPGYGWLGISGALLIAVPPAGSSFGYDIAVHAIALGFVLSMVFGHALIILPAITGLRPAYGAMMYVPLAALHASVLLRVVGGLSESLSLRLWSGPLTIAALVAFAGSVAAKARAAPRALSAGD